MVSRSAGNNHAWKCDWCPKVCTIRGADFYVALQRFKNSGWRVFKKDGKWMHICPDCRPKKGNVRGNMGDVGGGIPSNQARDMAVSAEIQRQMLAAQNQYNPYQNYLGPPPIQTPAPVKPPPAFVPQIPRKRVLDMGKIEDIEAPKTVAPKLDLEDDT
jgi:hypothetical protein